MANWWDAAPLAAQKAAPAAGANWWDSAPLVQDAAPASAEPQYNATQGDGTNPTRITPATPEGPPRQVGMAEAIGRGAAKGVTFNLYDELRGLVEASGADPKDPASLYKVLSGAYKYWSGDKEAEKRYDTATARERGTDKMVEEQRPISSLAGNVAGAVAMPIGGMLQAATLPGRMAAGAGVGAATGAAYGAGDAEGLGGRLTGAASGGAIGGALGGIAPAAIEGVVRGARAVAQPIATTMRGIRDVDSEAARRITSAVDRDITMDPTAAGRLTAPELAAQRAKGDPVNLMDMGGETTRALGRSAANTSPEGRSALEKSINERFEGQGPRVTSWLEQRFNYPDAASTSEAISQAAKTVNRPAYARAYNEGKSIWDDGLDQMSQAPMMQQAIRMAFVTGRNRAALDGFPPIKNPFSLNKETGYFELAPGATPNLQFWDHVKRNLDKMGAEGQAFSRALRDHLDEAVPSYKQARAGAAAFFGAEDALEAGQKFVSSKMKNSEAARELAKMKPHERNLFEDGFVSQYIAGLKEVGDRRTILNKIAESPAARERLKMVMGTQKANELEAMMRVEGIMDRARPAVQGNSTTARQIAELGLAGGATGSVAGLGIYNSDPSTIAVSAMMGALAAGRRGIDQRVSRRVAEMLASDDPKILMKGVKIVANNQKMFESLRAADKGIARISGEQSGGAPALQAAGVGRAEDQPNVPRPPGQ